jgi:hypothetical protein
VFLRHPWKKMPIPDASENDVAFPRHSRKKMLIPNAAAD